MTYKEIKAKALYYLSRREYAYQELFKKLSSKTIDNDLIKQALDDLVLTGYLSDERFITSFVNSKKKRYGSLKIKYLLQQKTGSIDATSQSTIYESQEEETMIAVNLLQKKFPNINNPNEGNFISDYPKKIRYLQSKGVPLAVIHQAIKILHNNQQYD